MKVRLVVSRQIRENYGAHNWDGKGECPQYWKCKGGDEVLVATLDLQEVVKLGQAGVAKLVEDAKLSYGSEYFSYDVYGYELLYGDQKSQKELDHEEYVVMGYEGKYEIQTLESIRAIERENANVSVKQ